MADRIPVYRSQIGVTATNGSRPVLPEVADAGDAIAGVGRSLLRHAEPILNEQAQREAIAAAGVAGIVKEGDGFRASVRPEGGAVYVQTFNRVMDERLTQLSTKAYEARLIELGEQFRDDPQGFHAAAEGLATGFVNAAPENIRAELEVNLVREWSERLRGLGEAHARRSHVALVNGLDEMAGESLREIGTLATIDTPDWQDRAGVSAERFLRNIDELERLGELSPEGAEAKRLSLKNFLAPIMAEHTAETNAGGFGAYLHAMSDEELAEVALMARGVPSGTVAVMLRDGENEVALTAERFRELFPDDGWRREVGAVATNALNARVAERNALIAEQRHAEAMAKQDALLNSSEALRTEFRALNRDPSLGLSDGEMAMVEQSIGDVYERMSTAEGRGHILGLISDTGYVPPQVIQYIDGQITGGNFATVAEFVQDFRTFHAQGTAAGANAYRQLSPLTRSIIAYDQTLRNAGKSEGERYQLLTDAANGRSFTQQEAEATAAGHTNEAGRVVGYSGFRADQLARAFGKPVVGNPIVGRDFDTLYRFNLQLHNGNSAAAGAATAREVAGAWKPDARVIGGFAPAKMTAAMRELGVGWGQVIAYAGLTGAQAAAARKANYRMRFESDNRGTGYGQWTIQTYDDNGRALPPVSVHMDDVMQAVRSQVVPRRRAQAEAARRSAGAANARMYQPAGTPRRDRAAPAPLAAPTGRKE